MKMNDGQEKMIKPENLVVVIDPRVSNGNLSSPIVKPGPRVSSGNAVPVFQMKAEIMLQLKDHIDLPYSEVRHSSSFTIDLLAKFSADTELHSLTSVVSCREHSEMSGYTVCAMPDKQGAFRWTFIIGTGTDGGDSRLEGPLIAFGESSEWVQLTCSYDCATRLQKFYVDGVLRDGKEAIFVPNTSHPLRIGAGSPGSSQKNLCHRLQVKQISLYDKAIVPWEDVGEHVKNGGPDPVPQIGEDPDTDAKACTRDTGGATEAIAQASAAASCSRGVPGSGRWFVLKGHPHLGMNLHIGSTYSEASLREKCLGDENKLE